MKSFANFVDAESRFPVNVQFLVRGNVPPLAEAACALDSVASRSASLTAVSHTVQLMHAGIQDTPWRSAASQNCVKNVH